MIAPEIIGKVPKAALAGKAPALGDIMRVRAAIDEALTVARGLLADFADLPAAMPGDTGQRAVAYHLTRLDENAAGYLSDYQAATLRELLGAAGGPQTARPDMFLGAPMAAPLATAVDAVDREIVAHEAGTVDVHERKSAGLLEAALILGGLGLLAWALS